MLESTITAFIGIESLSRVTMKNLVTGGVSDREIDGVFVFIGYVPNAEKLAGLVDLNPAGEIVVSPLLETSVPGVFAAGDSIAKKYRQVTTAVADGTIAALTSLDYLRTTRSFVQESMREPAIAG